MPNGWALDVTQMQGRCDCKGTDLNPPPGTPSGGLQVNADEVLGLTAV
jgi:hypothetical protein